MKKAMPKNRTHCRKMPRGLTSEETKLVKGGQEDLNQNTQEPDRAHIINGGL